MNRAPQKMRLKDRRRRASSFKYVMYGLLLVLLFAGVAYGARRPEITVASVTVEGGTRVKADDVQKIAEETIAGSYLFLVPKKMSFVVPTGTISQKVMAKFPEVAAVTVSVQNLTSLKVTLSERGAYALWCRTGTCYDMDSSGYIFDATDPDATTTLRTYVGSIEGSPVGATFLPQEFLLLDSYVTRVEGATKRHISMVTVTNDRDVFADFDGGGQVRFVMEKQSDSTLSSIASVFAAPEFGGKVLEYADFRFDNKAAVKFSK